MPLNIAAALAVKKIMERDKLPGTLMLWPGVAEELDGAKAWYIRDGVFKDVDVILFTHVGNNLGVSWGEARVPGWSRWTTRSRARLRTRPARRGAAGRALDAVELMSAGWQYRREHLRLSQRSHYVITNGGDQPNVVPRNASIWFYFREIDQPAHQGGVGHRRQDGRGRGADDQHDVDVAHPGHRLPQHMNKPVAETVFANIQKVGLPQWNEADQTLAKALQTELGNPRQHGPGGEARGARAAR